MKNHIALSLTALISSAAFAQVEITDSQRYLDSSTYVLNEPCIEFNGTQFMGQFVLETEGEYVWKILSGEELTESRTGCTAITAGSNENEILFNLSNLVIADGNVDTGQRYDVDSIGDATRLDLGFSITNAVVSAPALVHASNLELPLYFTNQTYGEGLEVCLSATATDSITISNENNSVELSLSDDLGNGLKSFCGTIAQEDLEFGDVFYDAQIGEEVIENAVTYWNPACSSGNGCHTIAALTLSTGVLATFFLTPQNFDSVNRSFVSSFNIEGNVEENTIEMLWDGSQYKGSFDLFPGVNIYRTFLISETGKRSLYLSKFEITGE